MFELKGNNFTFTGDVTELASAVSRADEKTVDRFLEGIGVPVRTYILGWILTHFYGDDYDDMVNGVLTTVGAPADVIQKFNTPTKNKCSYETYEKKEPEKQEKDSTSNNKDRTIDDIVLEAILSDNRLQAYDAFVRALFGEN